MFVIYRLENLIEYPDQLSPWSHILAYLIVGPTLVGGREAPELKVVLFVNSVH